MNNILNIKAQYIILCT